VATEQLVTKFHKVNDHVDVFKWKQTSNNKNISEAAKELKCPNALVRYLLNTATSQVYDLCNKRTCFTASK
jgi:hypothetical protein